MLDTKISSVLPKNTEHDQNHKSLLKNNRMKFTYLLSVLSYDKCTLVSVGQKLNCYFFFIKLAISVLDTHIVISELFPHKCKNRARKFSRCPCFLLIKNGKNIKNTFSYIFYNFHSPHITNWSP